MNHDEAPENRQQEQEDQNSVVQPEHDQVAMCLTELSIWKDQCKRISADFENFKKRTEKDQIRWSDLAKESILRDMLPFVDTFEIALSQQAGDKVGIEMVHQSLLKLLAKHEVVAMTLSTNFDPELHEAVMQVESAQHQSGEIVEVLAKGFMLKDRVLRPAKVSVAI